MLADEIAKQLLKAGILSVDFSTGRVYSSRRGQIGCLNAFGYLVSTLHFNGQRAQVKLHRVVWFASGGKIHKGFVIDHINRDKSDNRLINLRVVTNRENSQNRRSYVGEANPAAKIDISKAREIRRDYQYLKSYARIASIHKVSTSLVAQIIRGEVWV